MSEMTKETDVVVIGSGATGLAAALSAAEGGAEVIVFEKQRSMGGTSNFFVGTFAVESAMQRESISPTAGTRLSRQLWNTAIGGPIPDWFDP
jgi:succinate dehydrogenase/fumarate reductase flavoprotein subunit